MTTCDLRVEAAAEARRLTIARALLRDGDERAAVQLEGDTTWVARARRSGPRRSLGGRACLIWRVGFENASGRLVESRIVAVLLEVSPSAVRLLSGPAARRRTWIEWLIRHADGLVRARVEAECGEWRAAVRRVADAFTSARVSREREIVAHASRASPVASQPGLFDRRAERARHAGAAAAAESEREATDRRRTIADEATLTRQPARLLLVLVP